MEFSSKRWCVLAVVGSKETERRETEMLFMVVVSKCECCEVLQFQRGTLFDIVISSWKEQTHSFTTFLDTRCILSARPGAQEQGAE